MPYNDINAPDTVPSDRDARETASARLARRLTWFAGSTALTGVALLGSAISLRLMLGPVFDAAQFGTLIAGGVALMIANLPVFAWRGAQRDRVDLELAALESERERLDRTRRRPSRPEGRLSP